MNDRCFVCMTPLQDGICPHCGRKNSLSAEYDGTLLAPGVMIKNRYLIGLPSRRNGESVVYIGYDTLNNCKVRICEFFPESLCRRSITGEVVAKDGYDIQFKALMTDFAELGRQLMGFGGGSGVVRLINLLAANDTIYAVHEYVEGISLTEFLKQNGGELSWEEIEPLFMPLLYAVKLLNSNGIIHRGISPETIIVTPSRELKLIAIGTSAVRAINTEIEPELFEGYAAPEQYQRCVSHGEWTDIYALAAVLFKALTGTTPERGDIRQPGEDIISPRKLNVSIPYGVSRAIVQGMAYDKLDRTQTIREFINNLYTEQPVKNINPHGEMPQPLKKKKNVHIPVWLIVILITLPILLLIFFILYSTLLGDVNAPTNTSSSVSIEASSETSSVSSDVSAESSEPITESSSEESDTSSSVTSVTVNNFVGKYYEDIIATELYIQWFKFTAESVYDETALEGEVISQSIEPNTVVEQGTEIRLVVSKGKQTVLIPPTSDSGGNPIPVEDYKKYLEDNGVSVRIEYVDSFGLEPGTIDSLSVPIGDVIDRSKVTEVIIYVVNERAEEE